jgi:hypothetical protein
MFMFRKITTVLTLSALCIGLVASPAHAQFGGFSDKANGLLGDKKTTNKQPSDSNVKLSSDLVKRFVVAQNLVLDAQIAFANSFDLADQAQLLEAEKKALSSGSVDKNVLEKSVTVSERAQKAIDEKIKAQPTLSAASKAHYARGLIALTGSVAQAKKLPDAANKLMESATGDALSFLSDNKLSTGVWVAKETPGYLSALVSTTRSALSFGKLMGISLPKNADALLKDL